MKAKSEPVSSSNAARPKTIHDPNLTAAQIDAELMAIRAELKAFPDDEELTPKLHEIADDWLDKRSYLEFAAAAERLRCDQLASEFADHIAGVQA